MNAFKHGLAAIQKRREEAIPTEHEESVRQQILGALHGSMNCGTQSNKVTRNRLTYTG
jgi:hypothetical protein